MGCLINQGKQKIEVKDYPPIIENDACLMIEKIEIDKFTANTIKVTFRVLQRPNKNRVVYDRVGYNSSSPSVWKYQALRSAANVPYTEDEPAQIDIESILLHKPLLADLTTREYVAQNGEKKVVQDIRYKKWNADKFNSSQVEEDTDKAVEFEEEPPYENENFDSDNDGDLPFKSAVEVSGSQQQDNSHIIPAKPLDYDWD